MRDIGNEVAAAGAKLTPVGLIATANVVGWGPAEWMYALTAVYVVMQGAYLLWKWIREYRQSKAFAEKLAEPLDSPK